MNLTVWSTKSGGLRSQLRANIAEGYGRLSDVQFRHFLGNARGSLCEMRTQVELATDLGYIEEEIGRKLMEQSEEVGRIIKGLIASLGSARRAKVGESNSSNYANNANPASGKLHV